MHINLKGTNLELTESIRVYVDRKVGELERFIQNIGESPTSSRKHDPIIADVEVGKISDHHRKGNVFRTEINVSVPHIKQVLRAVSEREDLHIAIDEAKAEMQRQLKHYTDKERTRKKQGWRRLKDILRLSSLAREKKEE